ncbi:MAG: diaminopimelate epimerase [Bacteroidetes bacterium]|nr:MAG: diaminopimelate epimerase [Bacteroidota bacterium]
MKIEFHKYHGNGNDFIMLDNRLNKIELDSSRIAYLCDRHFGIGADGLIFLDNKDGFDFSLKYFNSDGNESTMCGNGGRCITMFAHELGIINSTTRFIATDGPHDAEILSYSTERCDVKLKMKDTRPGQISGDGYFIDTGSPHFVKFVPSLSAVDVLNEGRVLRNDQRFAPAGCNINFVELLSSGIKVRTYERGVENETLSCGTGVTASAIIAAFLNNENKGVCYVSAMGGEFTVHFHQSGHEFTEVYLEGPVTFVFKGEITI